MLSNNVLFPSHAPFTIKTVDPCKFIISIITTPIYPIIPILNGINPPLFAYCFNPKSRLIIQFVLNSYIINLKYFFLNFIFYNSYIYD